MRLTLPRIEVPATMAPDDMPDLLRHWYLGPRARRHMMLRRFAEVDRALPPGGDVLDIGSAWGFNAMVLARLGYRVVGMDLVIDQFPAGQAIAAHNAVPFHVAGANAAHLPFADRSFDAITMVETFEHIFLADRPRALSECLRVLRPGGTLVLSTPNHGSLVERAKRAVGRSAWLRRRLPTMCYPEQGTARDAYHPYRYHHPLPDAAIVRMLREAGFDVDRPHHFLFVLKNTSNRAFGPMRCFERLAERTPGLRRLAATARFVARRPLQG